MMRRWTRWLTVLVVLVALALVARVFQQFSIHDAVASLHRLSIRDLALGGLFAAASYASLTAFDYMGVRYAGHRLPYGQVALASFVSLSIGHTVGLAPLSSGAVRYRFYSQRGLDAGAVARVIMFSAVTVGLGELSLAAGALIGRPDMAAGILDLDPLTARLIGVGSLALVIAYLVAALGVRRTIRLGRVSFKLPSWRLALGQVLVGSVNYVFVAAALSHSLGAASHLGYGSVATAYIIANVAALMSHVPGGLGVIEAVIVSLFPDARVLGGLLAFRVIYFFVPFLLGVATFSAVELQSWMHRRTEGGGRPATDSAD